MKKGLKQFRYQYDDFSGVAESWFEFLQNNERVIAVGIQMNPGVRFRLNAGTDLTMGFTGIYELDLTELNSYLFSICVNTDDLRAQESDVIVDIIYQGGI